jgi:hypothetical protein
MKMSETLLASKYLKAGDLNNRDVTLKISHVQTETLGEGDNQEEKQIVYFDRARKGWVLNKTNGKVLAEAYGDETDDWRDMPVTLFQIMTNDPNGKVVPAIRCKIPTAKPAAAPKKADPISSGLPRNDFPGDRELDDDINF